MMCSDHKKPNNTQPSSPSNIVEETNNGTISKDLIQYANRDLPAHIKSKNFFHVFSKLTGRK